MRNSIQEELKDVANNAAKELNVNWSVKEADREGGPGSERCYAVFDAGDLGRIRIPFNRRANRKNTVEEIKKEMKKHLRGRAASGT